MGFSFPKVKVTLEAKNTQNAMNKGYLLCDPTTTQKIVLWAKNDRKWKMKSESLEDNGEKS